MHDRPCVGKLWHCSLSLLQCIVPRGLVLAVLCLCLQAKREESWWLRVCCSPESFQCPLLSFPIISEHQWIDGVGLQMAACALPYTSPFEQLFVLRFALFLFPHCSSSCSSSFDSHDNLLLSLPLCFLTLFFLSVLFHSPPPFPSAAGCALLCAIAVLPAFMRES